MNTLNRPKMYLWASALVLLASYGTTVNAGPTVRNYTASIDPVTVNAGNTGIDFTVTITNDSTTSNNQTIKSAKVQMPAGFSNLSYMGKSANISGWDVSVDGTTITVTKSGSQVVTPNGSLEIEFYADAGCTAGDYTWNSYAYGADDAAGTPYAIVGDQPSVTISGTCGAFTGWESGDYCSVGQGGWGADAHGNNPGAMRDAHFSEIYGGSGVMVGPGSGSTWLILTTSSAVNSYLPAGGTPGQLDQDYTNPTDTPAGVFGGQVLSLRLNVDFNSAGHLGDFVNFGTVILHDTGTALDGLSIGSILYTAESVLGGGDLPNGIDLDLLNHYVDAINNAFPSCEPSDFAQTHLMP